MPLGLYCGGLQRRRELLVPTVCLYAGRVGEQTLTGEQARSGVALVVLQNIGERRLSSALA